MGSILALFPLTFGACNSGAVVESVGRPGTWSLVAVPTTEGLTIVRGSGSTDVWLVGDTTILRWGGQHWNSLPAPAPSATGLWVNASSDVWLGAGIKFAYHWTGTTWTSTSLDDNRTAGAIWGSGASDVWASDCLVGYLGHYDGSVWTHLNSTDNGIALWGTGTTDVWMIDSFNCDTLPSVIRHWSGIGGLSGAQTQFTSPHPLQAIWGSGAGDIWAVGDSGTIVHYDGSAWSHALTSPTRVQLHGIWGTAASDVWAVGEAGVILHFDGSGWSQSVSPTTHALRSAWGSSSGDVWAVGDSGTVLHFTR